MSGERDCGSNMGVMALANSLSLADLEAMPEDLQRSFVGYCLTDDLQHIRRIARREEVGGHERQPRGKGCAIHPLPNPPPSRGRGMTFKPPPPLRGRDGEGGIEVIYRSAR